VNKAEYERGYYNADRLASMKTGYVHPYHSDGSPIYLSNAYYMRQLFQAVGPEQVSPHYESLSRSRRGLLFMFLYIGSINTISRFGGWEHNDWLRAMIWHHEFLIAFYVGFIETRHFSFMVGPKFSVFYNVYSNYEFQQLANQWADQVELTQNAHIRNTKEQLEYNRIDSEYEFVKKRAVVNFIHYSKLNADAHFHKRCLSMLNQVQTFESANLKKQMKDIVDESMTTVMNHVADPAHGADLRRASFVSALNGIRSGVMTYEGDSILPMIQSEIEQRLTRFQGLSKEEESALLALSGAQKDMVVANDRKLKNEFLGAAPAINHGTVKETAKFKSYVAMAKKATSH